MRNSKGITLVSLIITIIVMVILAGVALIFSVGEEGVIANVFQAETNQKYATIEERIKSQSEYISEGKNIGKIDLAKLESNINSLNLEEVEEINTTPNLLTVKLKDSSVIEIPGANGKTNEYGFYYNVDYVCYNYYGYSSSSGQNDKFYARYLEDGTLEVKVQQTREYFTEGENLSLRDITGQKILEIDSIEVNKIYTARGVLDSECSWVVDEEGMLTTNIVIASDKITYSEKKINIGGALICNVSEDGKSFTLNGKVFAIEEE